VFLVPELVLISSCPPLRGGSRREDEFVVCANPNSSRDEIDEKDEFAFQGGKCPPFSALIFRQNRRPTAPTVTRHPAAPDDTPDSWDAPRDKGASHEKNRATGEMIRKTKELIHRWPVLLP